MVQDIPEQEDIHAQVEEVDAGNQGMRCRNSTPG